MDRLKEPFEADQIEWRIGRSGETKEGKIWATALAYVQARAVQDRLDEVFGPLGWRVSYQFINHEKQAGVLCEIAVKDKEGFWVSKHDGAEQTDFEPFKGGISGAFKRAAVCWGIGRYLYGLEEEFVDVVDRSVPGARYGKLKTKDNREVVFHWLPRSLPEWALPKKDRPVQGEAKKEVHKESGVLEPWSQEQKKQYCIRKWKISDGRDLTPAQKATLLSVCTSTSFEQAMSAL